MDAIGTINVSADGRVTGYVYVPSRGERTMIDKQIDIDPPEIDRATCGHFYKTSLTTDEIEYLKVISMLEYEPPLSTDEYLDIYYPLEDKNDHAA